LEPAYPAVERARARVVERLLARVRDPAPGVLGSGL
jgi:hypothetical protein